MTLCAPDAISGRHVRPERAITGDRGNLELSLVCQPRATGGQKTFTRAEFDLGRGRGPVLARAHQIRADVPLFF